MGRRHTAGVVGNQAVGGVQVDNTTFTAADNLDIVMDPSGTGLFKIAGDAQLEQQGDLRFADADSSNYVAFQAPASVASNVTWTLPSADGSASQAIVTNGSGVLSFAAAGAALSDNTSDAGTNYLAFTTLSSGSLTTARVSTSKLTFQPSTGLLGVQGTVQSLIEEVAYVGSTTLVLTDRSKIVAMDSSGATTITIPNDSTTNFPVGAEIYLYRQGSGTVQITPAGGVTLVRDGGLTGSAYMQRYEQVTLRKRAANSWVAYSISEGALTTTGGNTRTTVVNDGIAAFTSGSSNFVVAAP